jgi:hypothetical protein
METTCFFGTVVPPYKTTRRYDPEKQPRLHDVHKMDAIMKFRREIKEPDALNCPRYCPTVSVPRAEILVISLNWKRT